MNTVYNKPMFMVQMFKSITMNNVQCTGFPIKDASFSKLKNISDLRSDIRKIKLMEIWTKNILEIGLFWETLYSTCILYLTKFPVLPFPSVLHPEAEG